MPDLSHARSRMVDTQIAGRGVRDADVLNAMRSVPRETFVEAGFEEFAYEDGPLPIGERQTISQPYIVALMIEAAELKFGDRVLEVGAGSGYAAAVMSRIADRVHTIERHASLGETARQRFGKLGYDNIDLRVFRFHAVVDGEVVVGEVGAAGIALEADRGHAGMGEVHLEQAAVDLDERGERLVGVECDGRDRWSAEISRPCAACCGNSLAPIWRWPMILLRRHLFAPIKTSAVFAAKRAFPPGFIGSPTIVFARMPVNERSSSGSMRNAGRPSPTRRWLTPD